MALERSGVTVVGAIRKSYFLAFIPGISAENSVPSMVMGRFMRLASSLARSMLKPSSPPPGFGMACGAKVASIPVRIGCCAKAAPATKTRLSESDRIIDSPLDDWILYTAVGTVERLVHHLVMPAAVPLLCIGLDAREHVRTLSVLLGQAFRAELAHLGKEGLHVEELQFLVLHGDATADHHGIHVAAHRTLHEGFDDVRARVEP